MDEDCTLLPLLRLSVLVEKPELNLLVTAPVLEAVAAEWVSVSLEDATTSDDVAKLSAVIGAIDTL